MRIRGHKILLLLPQLKFHYLWVPLHFSLCSDQIRFAGRSWPSLTFLVLAATYSGIFAVLFPQTLHKRIAGPLTSTHWTQVSGSKFVVATSSNWIADRCSDMSKTAKYWPLQTKSVHFADVFGFDPSLVPLPLIAQVLWSWESTPFLFFPVVFL